MMIYAGYVLLIVALCWILLKVRASYRSFGGTVMVTVYDAAFFPPVLAAFGLYWVMPTLGIEWPIWAFIALGFGLAVTVGIAIKVAEELGDRLR